MQFHYVLSLSVLVLCTATVFCKPSTNLTKNEEEECNEINSDETTDEPCEGKNCNEEEESEEEDCKWPRCSEENDTKERGDNIEKSKESSCNGKECTYETSKESKENNTEESGENDIKENGENSCNGKECSKENISIESGTEDSAENNTKESGGNNCNGKKCSGENKVENCDIKVIEHFYDRIIELQSNNSGLAAKYECCEDKLSKLDNELIYVRENCSQRNSSLSQISFLESKLESCRKALTEYSTLLDAMAKENAYLQQTQEHIRRSCNPQNETQDLTLTQLDSGMYYFSSELSNWHGAMQFCTLHGMQLASIENEEEEFALSQYLTISEHDEISTFWLSGSNLASGGGEFVWMSTGKVWTYNKWLSGEPNNANKDEHCVTLRKSAGGIGWNDTPCSNSFHFICETSKTCKLLAMEYK